MPRHLLVALLTVSALLLAGCGSDEPAPTLAPPPISGDRDGDGDSDDAEDRGGTGQQAGEQLRAAVKGYSDAFLSGHGGDAWAHLSRRCRAKLPREQFVSVVEQAASYYGNPLPFERFEAQVRGKQAKVSYTYVVSALDQTGQSWVRQRGEWRYDAC